MSQSDNPNMDQFTSYFVDFDDLGIRKPILRYISGNYFDQYQMPYPTHHVFSNLATEIYITNATFTNVTGVNGGTMTTKSALVKIENTIYQNCSNFGFDTFLLLESDLIELTNLTHVGVNGDGSALEYYVMMQLNTGGTAKLNAVNFIDCDLFQKPGLYFKGTVATLLLENTEFTNVNVGTSNAIVNAEQVSTLTLKDLTFTGITSSTETDEGNLMMNFQSLGLGQALDSSVTGIVVETSSISFLQFNSILGTLAAPVNIAFSDLVFRN